MSQTYQEVVDRQSALLTMWTQDGATPAGDPPGINYLEALEDAEGRPDFEEIASAHAESRQPDLPSQAGGK